MRRLCLALLAALLCSAPLFARAHTGDAPHDHPHAQDAEAFYDSLEQRSGAIALAGGKVALDVPATHYFIGPEDARRVIVELWGNPPSEAAGVEGMIFPAGADPAAGAWGAVLEYADDGHVKDDDAAAIDYDALLADLQSAAREANVERRAQGFDEITIAGWAEPPHYDRATRTLHWATQIDSSGGVSSLNYDIRVLGREGVLVVSFVADPAELDAIRAAAPAVMAMPAFTEGNRYADFRDGVDRVAAYGFGGLIAGGAAMAVAQKVGLLGLILAFGKKAIGFLIAGAVALIALTWRAMRRKRAAQA